MIGQFRKLSIKIAKSSPLAEKIKEKQERTLRNCRSKTISLIDFSERNSI